MKFPEMIDQFSSPFFVDDVSLRNVIEIIVVINGHLANETQDVLMQLFVDVGCSCEFDVRDDLFGRRFEIPLPNIINRTTTVCRPISRRT